MRKGQSTLEYVVVLTAIIAVTVAFASGFLRQRVQGSLEHASQEMENQVNRINFTSNYD